MEDYLLLIDGSAVLCTQYYGTEPLSSPSGEPTNGVYGFMKVLSKILKDFKPTYMAVCWDVSRNTFRKKEFEGYKANREETPDPLKRQFILCQELLKRCEIPQFFSKDFEADDFAGTISKKFENEIPIKTNFDFDKRCEQYALGFHRDTDTPTMTKFRQESMKEFFKNKLVN